MVLLKTWEMSLARMLDSLKGDPYDARIVIYCGGCRRASFMRSGALDLVIIKLNSSSRHRIVLSRESARVRVRE